MNEPPAVAATADLSVEVPPEAGPVFVVDVDAPALIATLRLQPLDPEFTIDPDSFAAHIESELGLVAVDRQSVSEAIVEAQAGEASEKIIATGEAPEPGADGHVEWLGDFFESHAVTLPDGSVDHYHRTKRSVYEGQPLARIHPPTEGRDGVDVRGQILPATPGQPIELELEESVAADPHREEFLVARRGGMVEFDRSRLAVSELLEIDAVGWDTGAVEFEGTLRIAHDVPACFEVRGGASVHIGGIVEHARVEAEGNLEIVGPVLGQGEGFLSSGHDMILSSVRDTEVHCAGRLVATGELLWCDGNVNEDLLIAGGRIVGGEWRVGTTVVAHELGSREEVATVLRLGEDGSQSRVLRRLTRERRRVQQQLQQHSRRYGPLLRDGAPSSLPPEELERHRERLSALRAAARRARREELVLRRRQRGRQAGVSVFVEGTVHPGVRLEFAAAGARLLVRNRIEGPVRIRLAGDGEEILIEPADASRNPSSRSN